MTQIGDGMGLWNDDDGFFLRQCSICPTADAAAQGAVHGRLIRSLQLKRWSRSSARRSGFHRAPRLVSQYYRPDWRRWVRRWNEHAESERRLLSLLRGQR